MKLLIAFLAVENNLDRVDRTHAKHALHRVLAVVSTEVSRRGDMWWLVTLHVGVCLDGPG